jgi:hypothetical protein
MRIDIGGGTNVKKGFINLDPIHGEGKFKIKSQDGIPIEDNSVVSIEMGTFDARVILKKPVS